MVYVKDRQEIAAMRRAGRIVAQTLDLAGQRIAPDITLRQLEGWCRDYIVSQDARPAFLGYQGFPGAVCISLNEEVVHGIPSARRLREQDLVKLDVGVLHNGLYADGARSFPVGVPDQRIRELLAVTEQALQRGIEQARAGNRVSDISHSVQTWVEAHGFSVVRELTGHGVGFELHEDPPIPNFGKPGIGIRLAPGMTLAIEPMVNMGKYDVRTASNGWTVIARDGLPSAHFEHTVLVTDGPAEILTISAPSHRPESAGSGQRRQADKEVYAQT